jgi:hypothetical protein
MCANDGSIAMRRAARWRRLVACGGVRRDGGMLVLFL